jgi:cytochrome d ubiquinol oxidase subunit I
MSDESIVPHPPRQAPSPRRREPQPPMSALDLARWQFGVTTVYHFLFVPITIGITWFVAMFETLWYRRREERYLRLTRFFGKLMLINFAIGVVTGIVQEFQFGMNWSAYSRYVGDVFGAPLAMEALGAFFIESTFLGLWVFGWGRLSPRLHLAIIYAVAFGSTLSAFFILAANSWMQHPVGYSVDPATGHAQMTSIGRVLTNPTLLYAFPHTVGAALVTAGMIVAGVSAWHVRRGSEVAMFSAALRLALPIVFAAVMLTTLVGHAQAQLMTKLQPMKMAAAEALYTTRNGAPFSLFAVAPFVHNPKRSSFDITIPHGLSILATNSWDGKVQGVNDLERAYRVKYGPGEYAPVIGVTYWTFRIMAGVGVVVAALTAFGLLLFRKGRLEGSPRYLRLLSFAIALPILANATGWIFTEMGRQPWVVQGLLKTANAVSPSVSAWEVGITLAGFTLLYGVLAAVDLWLMLRAARGAPAAAPSGADAASPEAARSLSMAY